VLRLTVEGGGCSGYTYNFTLESETRPDDRHASSTHVMSGLVSTHHKRWNFCLLCRCLLTDDDCFAGSWRRAGCSSPVTQSRTSSSEGRRLITLQTSSAQHLRCATDTRSDWRHAATRLW